MQTINLRDANSEIIINAPGEYILESVKDRHCGGTVVNPRQHTVDLIPRPSVKFSSTAGAQSGGGNFVRTPVCEGTVDTIDLSLTGKYLVKKR